ncbi:MAG: SDR family oxidoreductase [Thermoplasmata archaeon]
MSSSKSWSDNERVAVVTGATSGIGKEVARGLAAQGFRAVVVGRGAERAREAADEIARTTGNPRVDAVPVGDLARRSDMRGVASDLLDRYPRVDVLVNNAGAYFSTRDVTPDGLERTFALNVLAPFVLTQLLVPRLRAGAPSRVVQVTSAAHRGRRVNFDDLDAGLRYHGFEAYGRSKLELLLLTREFARRLSGSGIAVNAVHPGFIRSGFGDNNPGGGGLGVRVGKRLFARSVRFGASAVVFAATDRSLEGVSGEYFSGRHRAAGSAATRDSAVARRLFERCRELSGIPSDSEP